MALDLCDRASKYPNGFCAWPQPAYVSTSGEWVPSRANFTSLATPTQVGSGRTALVTLLHEGGHAAHFANVLQRSPFFSQERAPTSVAYAGEPGRAPVARGAACPALLASAAQQHQRSQGGAHTPRRYAPSATQRRSP